MTFICLVILQGSLLDGTFGAWSPATNEMELCDVAAAAGFEEVEEETSEIDLAVDEAQKVVEDLEDLL